ncbi:MAG TPA: hypothetical protein VGM10_19230 [Actinocrinis sp.]
MSTPSGFPAAAPEPSDQPPPGWGQPSTGGYGMPSPPLVTIGDIACTQTEVITPSGTCPIATTVWSFTDMSRTQRVMPTWAIVMTVIGVFFCLLGLLFLLVKEERTEGWVQIVVQGPGFLHQTQLPVSSVLQVQDYNARVAYARSLVAAAAR